MTYFLDTSALVKLYHHEQGRDVLLKLYLGDDDLYASELARLEFVSATTRKLYEESISQEQHARILESLASDMGKRIGLLHFSSIVMTEAERILVSLAPSPLLRTLDALQLSFCNCFCNQETVFVCSDKRLITAVEESGYKVLNPELSPEIGSR